MASNVIVNKWLDLADRVGWTAIQAAAGAAIAALATTDISWGAAGVTIGVATLVAICKVLVGQSAISGGDSTGSLIGQPTVEAAPTGTTVKK